MLWWLFERVRCLTMEQVQDILELPADAVMPASPARLLAPRLEKPRRDESQLDDSRLGSARAASSRLVDFYDITKPRMNFLVVATTLFGFRIAAAGPVRWPLLISTVVGTFLTASSASVLNQLIERGYDGLMPRTRNRPLPMGRIAPKEALLYGLLLGICGVAYLALLVNPLTAALGLVTIAWYLLLYTPSKRVTTLNTVIGAVPGAIPPMMGVAAAQNAVTPAALALFAILFLWQMPHFLAIAILYRKDYSAGGFKMLPCEDGNRTFTNRQIVLYGVALIPASLLPALLGIAGSAYAVSAILLGLGFLSFGIACATSSPRDQRASARKLFFASIVYLPLLLAAMTMNRM
jgi:protoheme IX farnesyltransferase